MQPGIEKQLSPMTTDLGDTELMMPIHTKGMHVTRHHKMSLYSSTLTAPVEQG